MNREHNILDHLKAKAKPELDPAYFEGLHASVMNQIGTNSGRNKRSLVLRPTFWISGVAAASILIFGIRYFMNQDTLNFKDLQHHEILAYIDENIDDFDEEMLAESLPVLEQHENLPDDSTLFQQVVSADTTKAQVLPQEFIPTKSSKELMEGITREDILNYLNSEEIDLEDLEESLF